jgi:hypothetical protein
MRLTTALVLVCLIYPVQIEAQPNCRKGKPCGNSCIARDKVCRVGAPQARPPAAAPVVDAKAAGLVDVNALAVKDPSAPWVAFRDGSIYYRNVMGCEPARVPVKTDRVYFKSEEDAKRAGLTGSKEGGCQ